MAWIYLILAGGFEIGWPVGLKLGWTETGARPVWLAVAGVCIVVSGGLLLLAQRDIPIGTAYAIWTGIGAIGTFVVGIAFFGDANSVMRMISVALIAAGIAGLKLA